MHILAIESSCDETAAAVVVDGWDARSNVVASQQELHALTGGVVPEVAARQHLRAVVPVVTQALAQAGCTWDDIDAIAATTGPGLPGALIVGMNAARGIAFARGLPFIPVDHIEGHVRANWIGGEPPELPALALVVSGGHTELLLIDHTDDADDSRATDRFERVGGTRDDAAGEAYDKVARVLGLGYPGGPPVSRLAATARDRTLRLPRAWLRGTDDFSFSGLKTAVVQLARTASPPPAAEIAWAFEESVADVLSLKTARVAEREGVRTVLLAGGVAANARLRALVMQRSPVTVCMPPPTLCTDNGAMIGAAAYVHRAAAVRPEAPLDVHPTVARRPQRRPARSVSP